MALYQSLQHYTDEVHHAVDITQDCDNWDDQDSVTAIPIPMVHAVPYVEMTVVNERPEERTVLYSRHYTMYSATIASEAVAASVANESDVAIQRQRVCIFFFAMLIWLDVVVISIYVHESYSH